MIYRLIYCSRNLIGMDADVEQREIASILKWARSNNATAEVTGALLYNGLAFAQVLEGPRASVDSIFSKIKEDPRHSHIVVLEEAFQPGRHFDNWAMAYADARSIRSMPDAELDFDTVQTDPGGFAAQIVQLLRRVVSAHAGEV